MSADRIPPQPDEPSASPFGDLRLVRVAAPVKDAVISRLRDDILSFRLQPGDRLVERQIIEQQGVSRATVREAISVLASEGLVAVVPQKGAHVAVPSVDDAADLYEVRASLESLVVRRFVDRASDEQVDALAATVETMRALLEPTPDIVDFLRAKDAFYDVLMDGARSASLTQLLTSIQARVRVLRVTSLSTADRLPHVVDEMRDIVAATRARNPERAARLMTEHIQMAASLALRKLGDTDQTRE